MPPKDWESLLILSNKYFPSWRSIIAGWILIIVVLNIFYHFWLKAILPEWLNEFYLCLPFILMWLVYNLLKMYRWPRNNNKKIGVVFCIESENETIKIQFLKKLRSVVSERGLLDKINLIEVRGKQVKVLSEALDIYRAKPDESTTSNPFWKIQGKIKGHYYVWGSIGDGNRIEKNHFFNLNSLVVHSKVRPSVKHRIQKIMDSIWQERINVPEKIDFNGIEITTSYELIALRYITGAASLISGNPYLSFDLLKDLEEEVKRNQIAQTKPFDDELKKMIVESLCFQAALDYKRNPEKAAKLTDDAILLLPENPEPYLAKSVLTLAVEHDIKKSFDFVEKAEKYSESNGTWRYNKAFLYMLTGEIKMALALYKRIGDITYDGEIPYVIAEVIQFIEEYLQENPKMIQFKYVLGFLYLKKVGNYPLAYKYFTEFLKKKRSKFALLKDPAMSHLDKCKKMMKIK